MNHKTNVISHKAHRMVAAEEKLRTENKKKPPQFNPYPFWAPRFWAGMSFSTWRRLLVRNRFRIDPVRIPMACFLTCFACGNSLLKRWQSVRYGKRIRSTSIDQPPIFILGHWRSGTTYLHELLSLDERFVSPTTFEVYSPLHFLITEKFVTRFFPFLVPSRRPMDDVAVGVSSPQEDEWALCNLGVPSPYLRVAFSNDPAPFLEYFNMEGVSKENVDAWKDMLYGFFQAVTLHRGKRLVLKSPGHTGRIRVLLELFPDAKFLHIVRNPYVVFPSTVRMWRSFDKTQSLQRADDSQIEEFVLEAHNRIYHGFHRDRELLAENQLFELKYEDFVRDPVAQLEGAYDKLALGGFDKVAPKLQHYVESKRDYRPNRHRITEDIKTKVNLRWRDHVTLYGYAEEEAALPQS